MAPRAVPRHSRPGRTTRTLRTLLALLERGALSGELIVQRRALGQISPGFFRYYLEVVR